MRGRGRSLSLSLSWPYWSLRWVWGEVAGAGALRGGVVCGVEEAGLLAVEVGERVRLQVGWSCWGRGRGGVLVVG